MEVIKAEEAHLEQIYGFICELEGEIVDKSAFTDIYLANIHDADIYYVLAVDGNDIRGFASLHVQRLLHHVSPVGELQEIIVSKDGRGTGIGGILFDCLKRIATEKGYSLFEVCCNQKRRESHAFYLKQNMLNSHFKFTLPLS